MFHDWVIWKAGVDPAPLEVKVTDHPGAPLTVSAEVLETVAVMEPVMPLGHEGGWLEME